MGTIAGDNHYGAPMVYLTIGDVFDLEECFDRIIFPGDIDNIDCDAYDESYQHPHPLDNAPEFMTIGEQIQWRSDPFDTRNGWQICFHESDGGIETQFQTILYPHFFAFKNQTFLCTIMFIFCELF